MDWVQQAKELMVFRARIHQEIDSLFQIIEVQQRDIQTKDQLMTQLLQNIPDQFYCPVCNSKLKYFNPLPSEYKINADKYGYVHFDHGEMTSVMTYSCPKCGASDRERLYAHWMNLQFGKELKPENEILHFAPESALSNWMKRKGFTNYKTADLMMSDVDYHVDITRLPFPDDLFDFVICSHVLEHVSSDDLAISELYRIIKPGGLGIIMAPVVVGLERTIEDLSIIDEGERWRLFGQGDHVRLYAHDDYVEKLKGNGFVVHELSINDFSLENFKMMGLKPTSVLYIVEK